MAAASIPRQRSGAPPRVAYTPREVAKAIGRPYKRVLDMLHKNQIRHRKVGQHYIIPKEALDEFLAGAS